MLVKDCFQPYKKKKKIIILANSILSSANALNLDQSRILSFGKELKNVVDGEGLTFKLLSLTVKPASR